ncbi:MAG: hypothetical protein EA378_06790 [Phycisphaerales bacterium]|nr:MAG: hypothetical protein EA378_06790 [Phycisphaerales bacterium]
MTGCGGDGRANADRGNQQGELRETGAALFGSGQGRAARAEGWSIVLISFRGQAREQTASEALERVRTRAGLPDAYIQQRGEDVSAVAYGRYPSPGAAAAQRDLERIRRTTIDGGQPFASAFLAPPIVTAERGPLRELDLRNARSIHGSQVIYTLQIGVYDPGPSPDASAINESQRTAEQAAAQLRREGELAFFYHGPNRSMVTVGLYTERDHGGSFGESPELQRAREQFPHNLLNGQAMRLQGAAGARLQPSFLVQVP